MRYFKLIFILKTRSISSKGRSCFSIISHLNNNLGKKKDRYVGYCHSATVSTEQYYKLADITFNVSVTEALIEFKYSIFQNSASVGVNGQASTKPIGTIVLPQNAYSFPKHPNGVFVDSATWRPRDLGLNTDESCLIYLSDATMSVITGGLTTSTGKGIITNVGNTYDYLLTIGGGKTIATGRIANDGTFSSYVFVSDNTISGILP